MEKIRLQHPHETLALIPHLVGFRPFNAVMLMGLRAGPDRSGGPIVRIGVEDDLPHELVDTVLEFVSAFDVVDLMIAWYGADLEAMINNREAVDILDTAGLAAQRYLDSTVHFPDDGFVTVSLTDYEHWVSCLEIRDAWGVSFDDLLAEGAVRPFANLNESPAITELVFHGSAPLDHDQATAVRAPWSERREAVEAARAERERTQERRKCGKVWQAALDRMREGMAPHELASTPEIIGLLNAGLDNILHRDRIILSAVNSAVTEILKVPKRQIGRLLGEATPESCSDIDDVIDVLEYIAMFSDDDDPAAFAVAAYLQWWKGDNDAALDNATAATESDSHYSLAKLVIHALFVDLPPPVSRHSGGLTA